MYKQENKVKENRKIKSEMSGTVCCLAMYSFASVPVMPRWAQHLRAIELARSFLRRGEEFTSRKHGGAAAPQGRSAPPKAAAPGSAGAPGSSGVSHGGGTWPAQRGGLAGTRTGVSIFHSPSPKIDSKEVSQSNFLLLEFVVLQASNCRQARETQHTSLS